MWARYVIHVADPGYSEDASTYLAKVATAFGVAMNRAHEPGLESVTIAFSYFSAPTAAWRLVEEGVLEAVKKHD